MDLRRHYAASDCKLCLGILVAKKGSAGRFCTHLHYKCAVL